MRNFLIVQLRVLHVVFGSPRLWETVHKGSGMSAKDQKEGRTNPFSAPELVERFW